MASTNDNNGAITRQTKLNKEKLLRALENNLGIVTRACEESGVSRTAYYSYMKLDEDFKREVEEISEVVLDFAEAKLYEKIKEGSERAIIFYLKHRGKKRGYSSNVDILAQGETISDIKINIRSNDDVIDDENNN